MPIDPDDYISRNNLDPDVFFVGDEGVITKQMCEDWIASHKSAINNPYIEYDNETGFYEFDAPIPDENIENLRENKTKLIEAYSGEPIDLVFTPDSVRITGRYQNPRTAWMTLKMVNMKKSQLEFL